MIPHQRQIERAATQIVNQDALLVGEFGEPQPFAAEHIAERGGDRFVDDIDALETGLKAHLDRRLPLPIAELGRHGDDRLRDRADLLGGRIEHLSQHERSDIDRCVLLAFDGPRLVRSDVALGVLHDMRRLEHRVPQRFSPDDDILAVEHHDRRRGHLPFLIGQRDRLTMFVEVREAGICGPQVNPNGVSLQHDELSRCLADRKAGELQRPIGSRRVMLSTPETAHQRRTNPQRERGRRLHKSGYVVDVW